MGGLFYYLAYFYYYSWVSLHFLVPFMSLTILFQLTFSFIYSTFCKKFSVSAKNTVDKGKKLVEIVQRDPWIVLKNAVGPMNSSKNKLNSKK